MQLSETVKLYPTEYQIELTRNTMSEYISTVNNIVSDYTNKDNGNIINTNILKINNEEDLKYMMKILTVVIRASIIDVITKKKSEEKAQEELQKQIEILKHGMIK